MKPLAYEAYQALADHYAAHIDTKPHNAYYDMPAVLGLLPDVAGKRVLDAGCGPGAYARALVDRGATVDAFDVSENMLGHARERLTSSIESGTVTLHCLDMTEPLTVFEDGSFHAVNAPLCLDYVEDWVGVFREFCRVLRSGGTFVFSAGHPSFDAEYFKTEQYFSVEQVESTWTGFGTPIVMPTFRRSLTEFMNPIIDAGLIIDRVLEPLPTEEFRKADSRRYERLMHRPGFLCIRATKP